MAIDGHTTEARARGITSLDNIILLHVKEQNTMVVFDFAQLDKVFGGIWAVCNQ
jgi:hypothetical protein